MRGLIVYELSAASVARSADLFGKTGVGSEAAILHGDAA
jgi:hypothetical protein